MSAPRPLQVVPVPPGTGIRSLWPTLRDMLAGRGPALLPVPADDPVRTSLLVDALQPELPVDDERAALVVCTSGSTGTPKGALLTAEALAASAAATEEALGGPGVWLLALPAHHIAGLQVVLRSLRAGYEPVVVDVDRGFDPRTLAAAVDACAGVRGPCGEPVPRYTSLVPGQLAKIVDGRHPEALAALAEMDAVLVGGAHLDGGLLDRARAARVRVIRTYGMSETAGGCVYDGRPLTGVDLDCDADSRVWLRGPQLALGYRGRPGHPAFARPGWFRTEDAGRIDDDGRLRILGRLDDALSVGGLTLLPQAVEEALLRHRDVVDAVVVGVPDCRLGTRAVAAVTLRGGGVRPSERELRIFVSDRLGARSAPSVVVIVPELPRLPGGKVDRVASRRIVTEGRLR